MIDAVAESDPPQVWALMAKFSGGLALDVGANAGQSAVELAPRFERVLSFEPAAESLEAMAAAGLPENVEIWPVAVSDHDGTVELVEQDRHLARGQLTSRDITVPTSFEDETHGWGKVIGTRTVECVTIDTITEQQGRPDLIKCDVEGHEVHVFRGAMATVEAWLPCLFIEVHSEGLGRELWDMLEPLYGARLGIVRHPHYGPSDLGHANHYWLTAWR